VTSTVRIWRREGARNQVACRKRDVVRDTGAMLKPIPAALVDSTPSSWLTSATRDVFRDWNVPGPIIAPARAELKREDRDDMKIQAVGRIQTRRAHGGSREGEPGDRLILIGANCLLQGGKVIHIDGTVEVRDQHTVGGECSRPRGQCRCRLSGIPR